MTENFIRPENGLRPAPTAILGVPFDPVTMTDAVDLIEGMIASRQPHYVVTPNVDFVVQAQSDPELHRILVDADLVVCDGTPVVWASRLLGSALPERVAGSDLVPLLIETAAKKGYRLFLLGATSDCARRAAEKLHRSHPALPPVAHYSPPFRQLLEMDHADIAERIREAKPDLLLVAFGCPKQEKWIAMNYRSLGVPVSIGVGATIDFLAGQVKRAPVWMQQSGTEWIFRLVQEPRRLFKRYVRDIGVFGSRMAAQYWMLRPRHPGPGVPTQPFVIFDEPRWQRIVVPARLDRGAVNAGAPAFQRIVESRLDCLLQLNAVSQIDSAGVGLLLRLLKTLNSQGRKVALIAASKTVRDALKLMHLDDLFLTAPDLSTARQILEDCAAEQTCPVEVRRSLSGTVLALRGEITAANGSRFWAAVQPHVAAASGHKWTIDLARVRFIDSSGIQLMMKVSQLSQPAEAGFSLVNPRPLVQRVLRCARWETPIAPTPTARTPPPGKSEPLVFTE